jgi:TIGR00299 family protein
MKHCHIDAFSGISGDMTVGALLDAGADFKALSDGLALLGTGASVRFERTKRHGIAAGKFHVDGGEQKSHRHLSHILKMIDAAPLPPRVQQMSADVFTRLGHAEAKVHAQPIEKVHFHEVGAVDSICDIVGACLCLHNLGIESLSSGPLNTGSGTVKTEHGVLPVPTPATADLLTGKPVYARGPELELTTPTGAALAATLVGHWGPMPAMLVEAQGYGAGDKDFPEHANVLRVLIGETQKAAEALTISVLESNIDDSTPEVLGYAMERLLDAGALDVTLTPLLMKKSRPGSLLTVLARPQDVETLAAIVLSETSSLGLRSFPPNAASNPGTSSKSKPRTAKCGSSAPPQAPSLPNMRTAAGSRWNTASRSKRS